MLVYFMVILGGTEDKTATTTFTLNDCERLNLV